MNTSFDALNLHHIGLIVPDLNAAMDAYISNCGMGFSVFEVNQTSSTFTGSSEAFNLRIGFGLVGSLGIELIQPVSGQTIHSQYLQERGPGLHHLGLCIQNLEAAMKQMDLRGYPLLSQGQIVGLGKFAYFEAADMHCIVEPLELFIEVPLFLAGHATPYTGK